MDNLLAGNPYGCFDWFKYTNVNILDPLRYATKEAPQMDGIFQMLQRIARV